MKFWLPKGHRPRETCQTANGLGSNLDLSYFLLLLIHFVATSLPLLVNTDSFLIISHYFIISQNNDPFFVLVRYKPIHGMFPWWKQPGSSNSPRNEGIAVRLQCGKSGKNMKKNTGGLDVIGCDQCIAGSSSSNDKCGISCDCWWFWFESWPVVGQRHFLWLG